MRDGELGVAIQGAGWVSTEHIRAYQRNPHVQVVAIGSRTREGAQRKAQEIGLDVPCVDTMADLPAQPGLDAAVSLHDTVNTHEACFAANGSAAEGGRPIKLPLTS